jgi:hypothetical protein
VMAVTTMTRRGIPIAVAVLAAVIATAASPADLAAQQQATTVPVAPRSARAAAQGFSIVLVVGDLQGAGGEEDVPPAARRALADMKDFLPYKSYKLVDAAWIMGTTHAMSRLRGPEDREYDIEISVSDGRVAKLAGGGLTSASTESRIGVSFSLREVGGGSRGAASADSRDDDQAVAELRTQLETLRAKLGAARARNGPSHPDVANLEQELRVVQARIESAQRGSEQRRAAGVAARAGGRAVINTSFSMDVGETVVVGTSRLSGNSKALIALLTAVPPKSSRR